MAEVRKKCYAHKMTGLDPIGEIQTGMLIAMCMQIQIHVVLKLVLAWQPAMLKLFRAVSPCDGGPQSHPRFVLFSLGETRGCGGLPI